MKKTRRNFLKDFIIATTLTYVPSALFGSHCLKSQSSNNKSKVPTLIVDIDFNDEVIIRPEPITELEVEKLVNDLHSSGVEVLLVRMGYLGYLPYHTDLSYPVGFDVNHARQYPFTPDSAELEEWIKERQKQNERYQKVLKDFNPPEIFINVGHKLGMKVIIWIDIFDDMFSGHRSKFIDEHPYCQWTARDGKTFFNGLISYAWPESRAFRVAQVKELLALGADGIHCSTSAHCRHLPNVQQNDFYGYEEPVVNEFNNRYGIDIRSANSFDKEKWHTIKGEFMYQLYKELAFECHKRNKEFWVGLQLGKYTNLSADPHFGTNVVARYENLWKDLVDHNIVDAFIVGDYELVSRKEDEYWTAKDLDPAPTSDLFSWAADYYQPYCKNKVQLYLFSEWLPDSDQILDNQLTIWAERVLINNFDGIDVHEAANFENLSQGWKILKRFRERLNGKNVPPL